MAVQAPFRVQVTVIGMTCQHCAMSVTEEIGEIPGVSAVDVRLDSGAVTVLADRAVGPTELAAAVSEAGFELVG
jgi:copper chaperone